jgi:SAM-dependent methyltransferase
MFLVLPVALFAACGGASSTSGGHGHGHGEGDGKGPLVHRFEKADDWVAKFDDPKRDEWQRPASVVALMQIAPGSTVADLGTGTGYFLPHLAKAVGDAGHVLALDVEPDMIRYVKERAAREHLANVEARVVPLDGPGLAEASVDRVLIVDTWHHIDGREAYTKKLGAGLRAGGAVYVVDFTLDSAMGPPKHHRLPAEQVVRELEAGGLHGEIVKEDLPEQYVVRGAK